MGQKAVNNSLAARGLAGPGGALARGSADYATGLASNTWQSVVNSLLGTYQASLLDKLKIALVVKMKADGMAVQELVKAQGMAVKELVEAKGSALQELVEAKVLTVNGKIDLVMLAIRAGFEQKQQDVAWYKTVMKTLYWVVWTLLITVNYFVLGFFMAVVIQQGPVDPSDQQGPVDPSDQTLRELVRYLRSLAVEMAPGVKRVAEFMHDMGAFKVLAIIANIMIDHE
jgi:hypothetical protein